MTDHDIREYIRKNRRPDPEHVRNIENCQLNLSDLTEIERRVLKLHRAREAYVNRKIGIRQPELVKQLNEALRWFSEG